jgi:hypothetical protein
MNGCPGHQHRSGFKTPPKAQQSARVLWRIAGSSPGLLNPRSCEKCSGTKWVNPLSPLAPAYSGIKIRMDSLLLRAKSRCKRDKPANQKLRLALEPNLAFCNRF